jgi:DNA replication protein DnaC
MVCYTETTDNWFSAHDHDRYCPKSHESLRSPINAMYEYRSIILTTNKEFTHWGEFFFDGNVAVPIVDRIIHHSHIFMLGGESYRLKSKLNN